jgi:hypothetical protein
VNIKVNFLKRDKGISKGKGDEKVKKKQRKSKTQRAKQL